MNGYTKYGPGYGNDKFAYVIFDDDMDMLLGQKDNFIRVNSITGLTQGDVDKAKEILNV